MKVFLIRHTSVGVPKGTCYGQADVPVADTFEQEASATKSRLSGMTFDHVYTSPLSRAALLADFCGFPDAERDSRLKEMNIGKWEMQRWEDISDPHLQAWYADYLHLPTTGGESFQQLRQRVFSFLDELKQKPYKRVAVFAHGGVLVCAGLYGRLFEEENCFSHQVEYGGVEEIEI